MRSPGCRAGRPTFDRPPFPIIRARKACSHPYRRRAGVSKGRAGPDPRRNRGTETRRDPSFDNMKHPAPGRLHGLTKCLRRRMDCRVAIVLTGRWKAPAHPIKIKYYSRLRSGKGPAEMLEQRQFGKLRDTSRDGDARRNGPLNSQPASKGPRLDADRPYLRYNPPVQPCRGLVDPAQPFRRSGSSVQPSSTSLTEVSGGTSAGIWRCNVRRPFSSQSLSAALAAAASQAWDQSPSE